MVSLFSPGDSLPCPPSQDNFVRSLPHCITVPGQTSRKRTLESFIPSPRPIIRAPGRVKHGMEPATGIEPSNRHRFGPHTASPIPTKGARSGRLTNSPAFANLTLVIPRVANPLVGSPRRGHTPFGSPRPLVQLPEGLRFTFYVLRFTSAMEPATGIEPATCGLRISDSTTSDNLTPQETTNQDTSDRAQDGPGLSCPGSSVVADSD